MIHSLTIHIIAMPLLVGCWSLEDTKSIKIDGVWCAESVSWEPRIVSLCKSLLLASKVLSALRY